MATIVLVHGARGGASRERFVAPRPRAAGHLVVAPTPTGLGDRSHPSSPAVDLGTHVRDVANVLFDEDLTDAVLAGHSHGGMVVSWRSVPGRPVARGLGRRAHTMIIARARR